MRGHVPKKPNAVFVIGPAGSGKSTVAKLLAAALNAAYLDKDTLAGPFVQRALGGAGQDPDARESNPLYRAELMPLEYKVIFDVARDNLQLGKNVVIDAPFAAYLGNPDYLAAKREDSGWPPEAQSVVAEVVADPEIIVERILARGSERDRWKLANWEEFWTRFGSTSCAWTGTAIVTVRNDREADLSEVFAAIDN